MMKVALYFYSINDCPIKISGLSWIIVLDPLVLSSFIIIQGELWNAPLSARKEGNLSESFQCS